MGSGWKARFSANRQKGYAVFATSRENADRLLQHLRAGWESGAPRLPVWLFTLEQPSASVAELCASVAVDASSLRLIRAALRSLRNRWFALTAVCWTGGSDGWPIKVAPLFIPPFRAIVLNRHGDIGSASPLPMLRSIAIAGAAAAIRPLAPFVRSAARRWLRLHAQPLAVPDASPPSSLDGLMVVEGSGRAWNPAAVEKALRDSTQRWVIFRQSGALADLAAARQLLTSSTFAITAQIGYRAWRDLPVWNAPYRALQPGEISATLAPISNFVIADREKILALGIPQALTYAAAWYTLFWKAAQAGWTSYSAGSGACGQMPDFTFEEAEFVLRNRTSLRHPELLLPGRRGSIASSLLQRQSFRENLPRVLILSPYLPFPLAHGGAVRMFNLCRALAPDVDFVLACFREHSETVMYRELSEVFREVYVVDIDTKPSPGPEPLHVREYESGAMRDLVQCLVREKHIGLLQIEYTQLAAYREAVPEIPAILVEHDITFTLYDQIAARDRTPEAIEEADRWRDFESHRLSAFDGVWTMSPSDREEALAAGADPERTIVVPNGVDLEKYQCELQSPSDHPTLLYVGSFRHRPNLIGFEQLRDVILPLIWQRFPDAILEVVAGPEHERHWREFDPTPRKLDPRIQIDGFVSDLRPLYERAQVVCVPLLVSAGTNIKVIEAMACSRPVVSTPVGARGLGLTTGADILIRESGREFADAVCDLLASPEKRERFSRAARLTCERRFGWPAIAALALDGYAAAWLPKTNRIYSH